MGVLFDVPFKHDLVAFCSPVSIPHGCTRYVPMARVTPRRVVLAAAHPPRRIGNVVKDLRQALQSSLEARKSRIEVTLPFGAKLGTETRDKDEGILTQRTTGDRELARIIATMFEGTGLHVCVAFATEGERAAAVRTWGSLAKCDIVMWTGGKSKSKLTSSSRKRGMSKTQSRQPKTGFGKASSEQPQKDPDVYIAVGGGAAFLARVRSLAMSVGLDKLVIVANGNSGDEDMPRDLQLYLDDEFETVYHYKPNPHADWSGGVLFRKFPDGSLLAFFNFRFHYFRQQLHEGNKLLINFLILFYCGCGCFSCNDNRMGIVPLDRAWNVTGID